MLVLLAVGVLTFFATKKREPLEVFKPADSSVSSEVQVHLKSESKYTLLSTTMPAIDTVDKKKAGSR